MRNVSFVVLFFFCSDVFGQQSSPQSWAASPELVAKLKTRRPGINYEEDAVAPYLLPDPLRLLGGSKVETAQQWTEQRRPELMEIFRSEVYGRRRPVEYKVRFEVVKEIANPMVSASAGREMLAIFETQAGDFRFPFILFLPKEDESSADRKTPAIIHINNRNAISLEKAIEFDDPFWPVHKITAQGYATASFFTSDVDPDRADGYPEGIRSFLAAGRPFADDDWRCLSSWGWAASRILDHLLTIQSIDPRRVAIIGHSRGGKTALWAAAEDERFTTAISNNSGCGGAALSRRRYGETIGVISKNFPHWFSPRLAHYTERESELPIDQHELIALIAPRAVYVCSADQDLWADPRGEYQALIEAAPVFGLFGKTCITDPQMPALDKPRHVGSTGYHIRRGDHDLTDVDWGHVLHFMSNIDQ